MLKLILLLLGLGLACPAFAKPHVAPTLAPDTARLDPDFTAVFRQTNHWAAGDGAISVGLADGRALWLFGDSFVDQWDPATGTLPGLFNCRNAAWVQSTNDLLHPHTLYHAEARDKSFFRPPEAATSDFWPCFWPGPGFQSGQTIYVQMSEIQKTPEGGMWGFKLTGQSWAKMSFPNLHVTGYVPLPVYDGSTAWAGFIPDQSSRFTYAFGSRQHGLGSDVFVARFRTQHPETNWEFWDGRRWSGNATNAAVIAEGASTSISVCRVRNTYLLLTTAFSMGCDQGREIFGMVSDLPTGPFSPRTRLYTIDDPVQGHQPFFYLAEGHPELGNSNGLLITYCINGYAPCLPAALNGRMNPDHYRPRAIRLPFAAIQGR